MSKLDKNNPEDEEKLYRYFTVYQGVIRMLLNRLQGKDVSIYNQKKNPMDDIEKYLDMDFEVFKEEETGFDERYDFSTIWYNNTDEVIINVLFLPSEEGGQINTNIFSEYVLKLMSIDPKKLESQKNPNAHFILLAETGYGAPIINKIKEIRSTNAGVSIETFSDINFNFDYTQHCLAPIKILHVPKSQVPEWEKKQKVKSMLLPRMLQNDPISVFYGAKVGDVFQMWVMGVNQDLAIECKIVIPPQNFENSKKKA